MSGRIYNKVALVAALLFLPLLASSQAYSGYTPYSIFGVGDMAMPGTAYNRSMGGVGIASRNNHFINVLNPAAVTARDTLSFMMDFSLFSDNKIYKQNTAGGTLSSANNTFNIGDCVMSFPIYRTSAMMIGIIPYSSVGYKYSIHNTDTKILSELGDVSFVNSGQGCIYQTFAAAGVTLWKKLSLGAQANFYFGNISKGVSQVIGASASNVVDDTYQIHIQAFSAKLGVQFEQRLNDKSKLCYGVTYAFDSNLRGIIDYARMANGSAESAIIDSKSDTLQYQSPRAKLAGELGLGVAFVSKRWRGEINYTFSDWRKTNLNGTSGLANDSSTMPFNPTVKQSVRAGVEFIPNINDIRYYLKKCAYRAGVYYSTEYYTVGGNKINSYGLTLGATLPIFRWYNGLTLAVDLGKRGSLSGGLVNETYLNFSVGVNLFDIWFQKYRYE